MEWRPSKRLCQRCRGSGLKLRIHPVLWNRLTMIWERHSQWCRESKSVCTVSIHNKRDWRLEEWEVWVYGKYWLHATLFHLYLRSSKLRSGCIKTACSVILWPDFCFHLLFFLNQYFCVKASMLWFGKTLKRSKRSLTVLREWCVVFGDGGTHRESSWILMLASVQEEWREWVGYGWSASFIWSRL